MILQVFIAMVAGWLHGHQQHVITYLKEENRVLKSKLPGGRLRLSDNERRALAALAYPLGRQQLKDTATIATPDTILRWYKRLIPGSRGSGHVRGFLRRQGSSLCRHGDIRYYTSYKVANMLVEFSTSIPRTQLRPGYGDGFLGAPLHTVVPPDKPSPREQGGRRGTSRPQTQQTPGSAPHV
jgi:hypothetical protein